MGFRSSGLGHPNWVPVRSNCHFSQARETPVFWDGALTVVLYRRFTLNTEQEYSKRHAGLGDINLAMPSTKVLQASNRRYCLDIGSE